MLDKAAAKSAAALFVCKNYGVIEKGRISGREMRKWHISLSNIPDGGLLQGERIYILNTDFMSLRDAIVTFEFYSSCGFHVLLRYFAIEKLRERSFQLVYFAREEYLIANRLITMRETNFKTYDDLPLMLSAPEVAEVLGISRAGAYDLVRSAGFPHMKLGIGILVPKDKFIKWIDDNTEGADD